MRRFCRRVRGIVSDMGTEYMISKMNDALPDVFAMMGYRHRVAREKLLFPRSLIIPGWRHKVD
eukprot:8039726-Pyramimonas_sp.AAC.1